MNPKFVLAKEFCKFFGIPLRGMTKDLEFMAILKQKNDIYYKTEKEYKKWLRDM